MLRVYRGKDSNADLFIQDEIYRASQGELIYAFPSNWRYIMIFERHSGITAKEFFKAVSDTPFAELYDFELCIGDVIEIDSGLASYFFQYQGWKGFKPAIFKAPLNEA